MHPIDVRERLVITSSPLSKQHRWFTASLCLVLGLLSLNPLQHRATALLGLEQFLNETQYIETSLAERGTRVIFLKTLKVQMIGDGALFRNVVFLLIAILL